MTGRDDVSFSRERHQHLVLISTVVRWYGRMNQLLYGRVPRLRGHVRGLPLRAPRMQLVRRAHARWVRAQRAACWMRGAGGALLQWH